MLSHDSDVILIIHWFEEVTDVIRQVLKAQRGADHAASAENKRGADSAFADAATCADREGRFTVAAKCPPAR